LVFDDLIWFQKSKMYNRYRNKYRIESSRLQNWDYGMNAMYYVTLCTRDRIDYFGKVVEGQMNLSEFGLIADKYWIAIPEHFQFVLLYSYVIMPNHIHGIIIINVSDHSDKRNENHDTDVETLHATSLHGSNPEPRGNKNENMSEISPKPGSLSTIIRSYKSTVTKHARQINPDFAWQSRFYDHIIRNDESLNKIRFYIRNNPKIWNEDKYYSRK